MPNPENQIKKDELQDWQHCLNVSVCFLKLGKWNLIKKFKKWLLQSCKVGENDFIYCLLYRGFSPSCKVSTLSSTHFVAFIWVQQSLDLYCQLVWGSPNLHVEFSKKNKAETPKAMSRSGGNLSLHYLPLVKKTNNLSLHYLPLVKKPII